jgi:hypothetical protein
MFVTPEEVMEVTPYEDVTMTEVRQAQFVIEIHVGRMESEVDNGRDKGLLARAVIAQVVYMRDNPEITFEQIGASYRGVGGDQVNFSPDSPFIAPLAVMAGKHLSWKQSRSIKIGRTTIHIKRKG